LDTFKEKTRQLTGSVLFLVVGCCICHISYVIPIADDPSWQWFIVLSIARFLRLCLSLLLHWALAPIEHMTAPPSYQQQQQQPRVVLSSGAAYRTHTPTHANTHAHTGSMGTITGTASAAAMARALMPASLALASHAQRGHYGDTALRYHKAGHLGAGATNMTSRSPNYDGKGSSDSHSHHNSVSGQMVVQSITTPSRQYGHNTTTAMNASNSSSGNIGVNCNTSSGPVSVVATSTSVAAVPSAATTVAVAAGGGGGGSMMGGAFPFCHDMPAAALRALQMSMSIPLITSPLNSSNATMIWPTNVASGGGSSLNNTVASSSSYGIPIITDLNMTSTPTVASATYNGDLVSTISMMPLPQSVSTYRPVIDYQHHQQYQLQLQQQQQTGGSGVGALVVSGVSIPRLVFPQPTGPMYHAAPVTPEPSSHYMVADTDKDGENDDDEHTHAHSQSHNSRVHGDHKGGLGTSTPSSLASLESSISRNEVAHPATSEPATSTRVPAAAAAAAARVELAGGPIAVTSQQYSYTSSMSPNSTDVYPSQNGGQVDNDATYWKQNNNVVINTTHMPIATSQNGHNVVAATTVMGTTIALSSYDSTPNEDVDDNDAMMTPQVLTNGGRRQKGMVYDGIHTPSLLVPGAPPPSVTPPPLSLASLPFPLPSFSLATSSPSTSTLPPLVPPLSLGAILAQQER
jgi:hypothetical protein